MIRRRKLIRRRPILESRGNRKLVRRRRPLLESEQDEKIDYLALGDEVYQTLVDAGYSIDEDYYYELLDRVIDEWWGKEKFDYILEKYGIDKLKVPEIAFALFEKLEAVRFGAYEEMYAAVIAIPKDIAEYMEGVSKEISSIDRQYIDFLEENTRFLQLRYYFSVHETPDEYNTHDKDDMVQYYYGPIPTRHRGIRDLSYENFVLNYRKYKEEQTQKRLYRSELGDWDPDYIADQEYSVSEQAFEDYFGDDEY